MSLFLTSIAAALLMGKAIAIDSTWGQGVSGGPQIETRSLDQIYRAALKEGGVVTLWHGGDEKDQDFFIKKPFEKRFPGITLNLTTDLSKYIDGKIDQQLASGNVYVDAVHLQTLHDFPRWAQQGALLSYAPQGFDKVYAPFKDSVSAYWSGYNIFAWSFIWNSDKLPGVKITSFQDFLKPEFKNKLVLTYPNDDDAILFAFDIILKKYGTKWFDALLKQNPRWVRGTATPLTILSRENSTEAATFTSNSGLTPAKPISIGFPTDTQFVSWPQTGAILKNAPHPEGAKLLQNFLLSPEFQKDISWSVREDVQASGSSVFSDIWHTPNTNPTTFFRWMQDRQTVERLRFWFEDRLGTAQGLSPLEDGI